METKFNFNSQVCTSIEQSERLFSLGLKKETADMCSVIDLVSDNGITIEQVDTIFAFTPDDWENFGRHVTPRWSLHRLIEMMPNELMYNGQLYRLRIDMGDQLVGYFPHPYRLRSAALEYFYGNDTIYDDCISCIAWLIKEGYFNKEYLV